VLNLMGSWLKPHRAVAAVAVLLVACAGIGGYFVGRTGAPSDQQEAMARDEARERASRAAEERAFIEARERGLSAGRREGERMADEQTEPDGDPDEQSSSEVAGPGDGCGEVEGFPGAGLVAVQVEQGSAPCDEVRDVFSDLFTGQGVSLGSTAEGTRVGDWTCFPTRMGGPSECVRGEEPNLTRVLADDGSG
jgi:hypothetical protein